MTFEKPKEPTTPENGTLNPIADMDSVLKKIPPIEGVFSPEEEVKEILALPTEKRKEALAEFRDKLARQVEAWKECRIILEESVEADPDISKEDMDKIVKEFASNYGFPEERVKLAGSIIEDYLKKRREVLEMREKYPDDIELINELTGLQFGEKDRDDFQLVTGPMYFEIYCSRGNAARIDSMSMEPPEGDFKALGFTNQTDSGLIFLVINTDYAKFRLYDYLGTIRHEGQHAKDKILRPKLFHKKGIGKDFRKKIDEDTQIPLKEAYKELLGPTERFYEQMMIKKIDLTPDGKERDFLLGEIARFTREVALNLLVKAEIFAKFKGGQILHESDVWNDYFAPYHAYDYLGDLRHYMAEKGGPPWEERTEKILLGEYREILENAVATFNRLLESGYRTEEVIAMLTDKRLTEWPKMAKRLLKEKKNRELKK